MWFLCKKKIKVFIFLWGIHFCFNFIFGVPVVFGSLKKTIVIHSMGTLGDLFPFLKIATQLKKQGLRVIYVTQKEHMQYIKNAGLEFCAIRPDFSIKDSLFASQVFNPDLTASFIFNQLLLPHLSETYEDLLRVCSSADMLISGSFALTARLVAEKLQIPWVSITLQPFIYMSTIDPPVTPSMYWFSYLKPLGRFFNYLIACYYKRQLYSYGQVFYAFRKNLGLSYSITHDFALDYHSEQLDLALFPSWFASKQLDWPLSTHLTGFIFDDQVMDFPHHNLYNQFIKKGTAPIVFTLGSGATYANSDFYNKAILVTKLLNKRAVFITGKQPPHVMKNFECLNNQQFLFLESAPYSNIFSDAAVVVHQGGIGTIAQVMQAGKPMLVIPFAGDQFDNALRIEKLGVGRWLMLSVLTVNSLQSALGRVLTDAHFLMHARCIQKKMNKEDGITKTIQNLLMFLNNAKKTLHHLNKNA